MIHKLLAAMQATISIGAMLAFILFLIWIGLQFSLLVVLLIALIVLIIAFWKSMYDYYYQQEE